MIKGWIPASLIDYPGRIAAVLFLGGCNLRCPMCHNAALIDHPQEIDDIPVGNILAHLAARKGRVTGAVVSGGEPCLQPDLPGLLGQLRAAGVSLKLDTNGTRPGMLKSLLDAGLLDAVAMDIKAPPAKYAELSGTAVNLSEIEESIRLLRAWGGWVELRTTVVPGVLGVDEIKVIGAWLSGLPRYVLQQFSPQHCYAEDYRRKIPLPSSVLRQMAAAAAPYFSEVHLRGV